MTAFTLASGFQPSSELTTPEFLFGRNQEDGLLDSMVRAIGRGTNYHLYGERRAGKSSLLHCCGAKVQELIPTLVPIYLNFRLHNTIVGASNVHRFVVAKILAAMYERGLREFSGDRFQCLLSYRWEPIYESLLAKDDFAVPGLFDACIDAVQRLGFGVVLLIDEYEHLMIHSYAGQPGAFFVIRDLSARAYSLGKPKALTFVMAGAELWQDICEIAGSPELNTAITSFDVGPISYDAFSAMWTHCLETTDEHSRAGLQSLSLNVDDIYFVTGGWPFYGKLIGHHALAGRLDASGHDVLLRPYFDGVWRRIGLSRRLVLMAENGSVDRTAESEMFARRGILMENADGGYVPCGEAWSRYVREHASDVGEYDSAPGQLSIAKRRLLTRLDQVQRIVYADDMQRQATAESFKILDDWAERCTSADSLQDAFTALLDANHREASLVIELARRLRSID